MDQDRPARALLVLTFATGVIDAASFLALGQVFAAMQTGNVIFLGLGIAGAEGAPVLAPLIGLGSFLLGSVLAATAIRDSGLRQGSETVFLLRWLTVEALLLAAVAGLAAVLDVTPGEATAYCLIALLAILAGAVAGALLVKTSLALAIALAAATALAAAVTARP